MEAIRWLIIAVAAALGAMFPGLLGPVLSTVVPELCVVPLDGVKPTLDGLLPPKP